MKFLYDIGGVSYGYHIGTHEVTNVPACEHMINGFEVRFKLLSLPLYFCNQIDRLVRLARP